MKALFAPESIAVFGASDRPGSWGRRLAEGARRSGVDVQLINRRPPFQAQVERPVQLAVIAVPAADFEATVDTALAAGAQAVVGITAGVSPSAAFLSRVRAAGAVLLGPRPPRRRPGGGALPRRPLRRPASAEPSRIPCR